MVGHLHVGGRNIRLLNVTGGVDPSNAPVVCESRAEYGDETNVAGNEAGFLTRMTRCAFDPPARLRAGEAYVVRAEYGADRDKYAPARFPPPYEGVMGYVTIAFTVPKGAKVAAFSASGTPAPTQTRDSGTCEANWRETGGDTDHDHDRDHEMDERDRIGASFVASPETPGPGPAPRTRRREP